VVLRARWEFALALLFLLTRLPNLTLTGMGYDEATYLYWGQHIAGNWEERFFGAGIGGKQPLHAWLVALSESIIADPVLAGRLVSVFTGALTLLALYLTARRLFSRRVAIMAGLLYVVCPFTLVFDRQAMIDSLLSAEAMWMLYFGIRLLNRRELLPVLGLALSFGAALLTKTIGAYFALLLLLSPLIVGKDGRVAQLLRWLANVLVGLAMGFVIYYALFGADPASARIAIFEEQYGRYTMSLSDMLRFPWQQWGDNTAIVIRTFADQLTVPLALTGLLSILAARWLGSPSWLLAGWVVLPIAAQVLIAARFYDRYILFSIPPLLILTARSLDMLHERWRRGLSITVPLFARWPPATKLGPIALAALLLPAATLDVSVLANASGGYSGLTGVRQFIAGKARSLGARPAEPIYVIADSSPAPVEDGTAVLLHDVPNVKVLRIGRFEQNRPLTVFDTVAKVTYPRRYLETREVYYVHEQDAETKSRLAGHLRLIRRFPHSPEREDYVGIYEVHFDDAIE
jgi:4-amino-4-deoxy-L-arabinose transferase-like glycosyltransferase